MTFDPDEIVTLGGAPMTLRAAILPNLPAVAETVPGFSATSWWGIVAPAGTPQAIIDKLHKDLAAVQNTPATQEQFDKEGASIVQMSPADFGKFMQTEMVKWERVVKEGKIKAE